MDPVRHLSNRLNDVLSSLPLSPPPDQPTTLSGDQAKKIKEIFNEYAASNNSDALQACKSLLGKPFANDEKQAVKGIIIAAINRHRIPIDHLLHFEDFSEYLHFIESTGLASQIGFFSFSRPSAITVQNVKELTSLCPNLEILILNNQNFMPSALEAIGSLARLQELDLSSNSIAGLPVSIMSLAALQSLNLANNELISLPAELGQLKSLKILDVSENLIETLPSTIGGLAALESLNASLNYLKQVPESIGNLRTLRRLHLSSNDLITIPESIGYLRSIENLLLDDNKLITIPETIANLHSLSLIDLSDNEELPKFLQSQIAINQSKSRLDNIVAMIRGAYEVSINNSKKIEYHVPITPDEIEEWYPALLISLAKLITLEVTKIKTLDGRAEDRGGVARNFISQLFDVLAKNHVNEENEPAWDLSGRVDNFQQLGELYENVGKFMAFNIRVGGKYPIGPIFHKGIFEAIKTCRDDINLLNFDKLRIEDLLDLAKVQPVLRNVLLRFSPFLKATNPGEASKYLPDVLENLFDLSIITEFPKEFLEGKNIHPKQLKQAQAFVLAQMLEHAPIQSILKPIYHMIKGFSKLGPVWKCRSGISRMEERVQGFFDKEAIVNSIVLSEESEKTMYLEWLREWIIAKEESVVRNFLWFATGSKNLYIDRQTGKLKKLKVASVTASDGYIAAHTCTPQLDILKGLSKEQLFAEMDEAIVNLKDFQMG